MADDMDGRYQSALARRLAGFAKITAQGREDKLLRGKTREEKERFKREQAAQAKRDARLNQYDVQGTNQRAGIAADAAYNQQGYTLERDKQQTFDQLKRDASQQGYTLQRDDRQQRNQLQRDAIQQGYGVQNDDRQFGQQLQRDAIQQDYGVQDDERQFGQQSQRDTRLNQFDTQQDERQQGYTQQNATQRETFAVTAKWQDQIQQARNAGMDFSADQKKEMQSLNRAFSKNVMNNPNYDEGLKQKAGLILQQKLAGIVPDERVSNPDDEISQTFKYNEEMKTWLKRGRDSQGNPDWEPIGSSSGGQQKEDPQIARQRDAMFKREDEYLKIRDKIASKADPETGEPLYSDDEIDKLAMDEFAPKEAHYRSQYGLPPQAKYQQEADRKRQEMEQQLERGLQRPEIPLTDDGQPGNMANSLKARSGDPRVSQPPVLSSRSPLSPEVSKQLQTQPGGAQLHQIREKHKSNSAMDQTVRLAADVVINAILTKDTSDPDLQESIDILKRAGFKME